MGAEFGHVVFVTTAKVFVGSRLRQQRIQIDVHDADGFVAAQCVRIADPKQQGFVLQQGIVRNIKAEF